jgi:hypothetical protein
MKKGQGTHRNRCDRVDGKGWEGLIYRRPQQLHLQNRIGWRCTTAGTPKPVRKQGASSADPGHGPPNVMGMAPCRCTSMPSMPAIIPAISAPTFTSAFIRTCSATSSSSPISSANRIASTTPACETRVGSSKPRVGLARSIQQLHLRGALSLWSIEALATPIFPGQRALPWLRHTFGNRCVGRFKLSRSRNPFLPSRAFFEPLTRRGSSRLRASSDRPRAGLLARSWDYLIRNQQSDCSAART